MVRQGLIKGGMGILTALYADRWLTWPSRWAGAILMMHRVRPAGHDPFQPNAHLQITPEYLDCMLARLAELGIRVVSFEEAQARLASGYSERFVVLTFDDGYADNFEFAWPVLRRHGVQFTVFLATGLMDGTASAWWLTLEEIVRRSQTIQAWIGNTRFALDCSSRNAAMTAYTQLAAALATLSEAERDRCVREMAARVQIDVSRMVASQMMTWDQVALMAADPAVTLGAHTVDHPSLAGLADAEARDQIARGIDIIETRTGRRPAVFAYPFGGPEHVSNRDVAIVRDLGISLAVTTTPGILYAGTPVDPLRLPRVSINGHFQTRRSLDMLLSGIPFLIAGMMPRQSQPLVARGATA
jgi:peptidoglycan/xylan/chitin deacetylase (PgdA/CDA1 family)